jgi:DNA-binding GntR family transcriptional regulator
VTPPGKPKSGTLSKPSSAAHRASPTRGRKAIERSEGGSQRGPAPVEEEIYALLTRAIITKQIRPGTRIREAAVAARFKVSRARVRRVLHRLAELDVVKFRLNFGAYVYRPSPDESRAVFRTRRVLEAEAVKDATHHGNARSHKELRTFVEREAVAYERDQQGLTAVSSGFHLIIAEMSGNPVLAKMLNQLVHRCVLIQALYERQSQKTICLVEEHAEIAEIIRQKRTAEAVAAMDRHISHIEESLDYSANGPVDERLLMSVN